MLRRVRSPRVTKIGSWWTAIRRESVARQVSVDEFWRSHVWTGVAIGDTAAAVIVAYLLMVQAGENRAVLVGALIAGVLSHLWLGFVAARMRQPRQRMMALRGWLGLVVGILTVIVVLDGGGASPLAMLLPAPVIFAALTCSPRCVGVFALAVTGVEAALPVIGAGGHSAEAVTRGAIAVLLCLLAVGAAVNRQRYDRIIGKLTDRLARQASIDALTGLPNRRRAEERLAEEILRCRRSGATFLLVTFDLDRFKNINDTYGHAAGDELLRTVAAAVRAAVRATDFVSRTGGDEFAAICPDIGSTQADLIADKIRDAVAAADPRGIVTASVGVAVFADPDTTADELASRADLAMYEDKSRLKSEPREPHGYPAVPDARPSSPIAPSRP